jgi:hypothetical protein
MLEHPAASSESLAPRPLTVDDTGLSRTMLADLVGKHLLVAGTLPLSMLGDRLALPGCVLEPLVHFLRADGRVEVRPRQGFTGELRFGLTERGREEALDAQMRDGYVGPAPVPLPQYSALVAEQSARGKAVNAARMRDAYRDAVVPDRLLDQLGPALNSGRPIFIYGDPGTGKTFLAHRLARALEGPVLVPYAIAVDDAIVRVFDPLLHRATGGDAGAGLMLDQGYDRRYVQCTRPAVVTGGELSADMLEVRYDPATREYHAPLQLRANGGVFLIDDLGRQRITPAELFNRWIVPMEEWQDYLALSGGRHFTVPFDVILVFATNIEPLELADEAFLRRIGHKVELRPCEPDQYREIWRRVCAERGLAWDASLVEFAIGGLHRARGVPLLPCHPRDLIGIVLDRARYLETPAVLTPESLTKAWDAYFVRPGHRLPPGAGPAKGEGL